MAWARAAQQLAAMLAPYAPIMPAIVLRAQSLAFCCELFTPVPSAAQGFGLSGTLHLHVTTARLSAVRVRKSATRPKTKPEPLPGCCLCRSVKGSKVKAEHATLSKHALPCHLGCVWLACTPESKV